ncbi:ATP-binding protein [uncultured Microbacterium sp.]|uniref:ATP-binding protein n=1 Tax=uncultured Microbacterium sp. TaxID=191216 RepID=UPI0025F80721|nr:ATP-binding protein [uncultured Microbacterium sp.]
MTAERIALDPATRRPLGDISAGVENFTQARVERIIVVAIGSGSTLLGTQGFLNALAPPQEDPLWRTGLVIAIFLPLALMVIACFAGVAARGFAGVFAVVFPLALLTWPLATAGRPADPAEPWIWYLLNVATSAAVVAFRIPLQVVWAVLVPVLFGVVRIAQVGTAQGSVVVVVLDVVYALILAGVVITLGWMLRSVAAGIDETRGSAVASYAAAAAADAVEKERVAVAALMHDSVLAALIAAERATTDRERTLAVSMAREALTRLANADQSAGEGPDEPVDGATIAAQLEAAARDHGQAVTVARDIDPSAPAIPGRVARALILAAAQAIANAIQHAHGAGLTVEVSADREGVRIRVGDTGHGFDPAAIPDDRLGIRASIIARVAAAAGRATVDSSAAGTVVTLTWEQPR